jgi:hypothetical protein
MVKMMWSKNRQMRQNPLVAGVSRKTRLEAGDPISWGADSVPFPALCHCHYPGNVGWSCPERLRTPVSWTRTVCIVPTSWRWSTPSGESKNVMRSPPVLPDSWTDCGRGLVGSRTLAAAIGVFRVAPRAVKGTPPGNPAPVEEGRPNLA